MRSLVAGAAVAAAALVVPVTVVAVAPSTAEASLAAENCRGASKLIRSTPATTPLAGGAAMRIWDNKKKAKPVPKRFKNKSKKVQKKARQRARIKAKKHLRIVSVTIPRNAPLYGSTYARATATGVGKTSRHARSGPDAVVVTNGSVFRLGGGGPARGPQVVRGSVLKANRTPEKAVVTLKSGRTVFADLYLRGQVQIGALPFAVAAVNEPLVYGDGVSVYTNQWGNAPRSLGTVDLVVSEATGLVISRRVGAARGLRPAVGNYILSATGLTGRTLATIPVGTPVARAYQAVARTQDRPYVDLSADDPVRSAVGFSSRLIVNGAIKPGQCSSRNEQKRPRTVYGLKANGDVVVMTVSGRYGRGASLIGGASVRQVSRYLRAQGVVEAVNLDGGGSTTMFVRTAPGQPLVRMDRGYGTGKQRKVGNAFGFGFTRP
jgi:exopolysaccharide biosynthesis protein